MNKSDTASQRFVQLNGQRTGILLRSEKFSRWTIPKIFPEESRKQDNQPLVHDFQSLGAQCVNFLANRLMMTLFAPSRPFFRLGAVKKLRDQMAQAGVDDSAFVNRLARAEKEASEELDKRSIRSKMYDLLKHLIIVGNVLMITERETIRILSLRNYCVKRNVRGEMIELLIREKVHKDTLDQKARAIVENTPGWQADNEGMVCHYHWVKWRNNSWWDEQWVDDVRLPMEFTSKYTKQRLPYNAQTWDLASGDDYGTGLVEDFAGDFAALSLLSKAAVQGAILASEYRWLVNPMGATSPTDLEESENGAALPGEQGDISLVAAGAEVSSSLQVNANMQQVYVNRIGAGFMLQSAVTRQAERVTTVELRMNAEELEGGLGGAYSRIAVDVQVPLAYWTMGLIDHDIIGTDIEPTIITGLAALSRTGDRDRLLSFAMHLSQLANMPPQILDRLKLSTWMDDMASAEGLDRTKYVTTDAEYNQLQQQRAVQEMQRMGIEAELQQPQGQPQ